MKRKERIRMKGIWPNMKGKKQFKKLTADTVAMKEKMEKMQLAFRKA